MIEAGVEVKTFLPLSFPRFLRSVNYRNHKKIVIIDGRIAYTGGINVKDVYIDGLPWGNGMTYTSRLKVPELRGCNLCFWQTGIMLPDNICLHRSIIPMSKSSEKYQFK